MTRSRHLCGKRWPRAIACALSTAIAVLVTAFLAAPGALAATTAFDGSPAPLASGPHHSWVKYYIVPPVEGGNKAYLVEIAAQTLGSGSRYTEIVSLNRGRLQPDGTRMENPNAVGPGWILRLPADAHGPGVHFGPLPGPYGAGQGGGSPVRTLVLRGLVIGLALALVAVLAVRAGLPGGRQRGRHTYQGARSHATGRPHRSALVGRPPVAGAAAGPAGVDGTAEHLRVPLATATGVISAQGTGAIASPPGEKDRHVPARGVGEPSQASPPSQASLRAQASPPSGAWPPAKAWAVTTGAALGREGGEQAAPAAATAAPAAATAAPDPGARRVPVAGRGEFSPAALRLLGVRASAASNGAGGVAVTQRHEVVLGECQVQAVLAEAPASNREGRSPEAQTWVAAAPYLVWTPLPHNVPDGGLAFACIGAGDEGCLFIDLAAAPGAVAFGGEHQAAATLTESIAYQLCSAPTAEHLRLVVVGDAVPAPLPTGSEWAPDPGELRLESPPGCEVQAELVFCRLTSNEDLFPLARYVARAPHRVIPLVLGDLPGAPWSFTAHPSHRSTEVLQPVVS
jgi:hypothetical protein